MDAIERGILELLARQHVITKAELFGRFGQNGVGSALERLREQGLIEKVESLGTSFVITKAGIRKVQKME